MTDNQHVNEEEFLTEEQGIMAAAMSRRPGLYGRCFCGVEGGEAMARACPGTGRPVTCGLREIFEMGSE
jgi:hypothetical protein